METRQIRRSPRLYCGHETINRANHAMPYSTTESHFCAYAQRRRPRRPPFLLVESDGVGVTSSIRPMRMPARARARRADWAPGPGVLVPLPPVARILTWRAVIPSSAHVSLCTRNLSIYPTYPCSERRHPGLPTWRRRESSRHGRP